MLKSYNLFSSLPFDNDYKNQQKETVCIAFRMARIFWENKNPFDILPMMFLHPSSSRIVNKESFELDLFSIQNNMSSYLLMAKVGLLAGEAQLVLNNVEGRLKLKVENEVEYLNLKMLKNFSLFILGKYYRPSDEKLTSQPLDNCLYLLSLLKLESLKNIKDNEYFLSVLNIFQNELIKIDNSNLALILEFHILKYRIEVFHLDFEESIADAVLKLDKLSFENEYHQFLVLESKRRIQEFHFNCLFNKDLYLEANRISKSILEYDKYCPRAHFLNGKSLLKLGNIKEALISFLNSIALNKQDLGQISKNLSLESLNFFFRDKEKSLNDFEQKFQSFFDPAKVGSLFSVSNGPWLQWKSIELNRDPYFQTLTTQRALPVRFRKELFFGLNAIDSSSDLIPLTISYSDFLLTLPQEIQLFLVKSDNDYLKTSQQSRLLASLGFYEEAFGYVKNELNNLDVNLTLEKSYLISTAFFIEQILFPDKIMEIYHRYNLLYQKIPVVEKSLRIRLTMQMSLCVISGQNNEIGLLKNNYEILLNLLKELSNSKLFSEFEKNLLCSRAYRASSYLPYLLKDNQKLIEEIDLCHSFAFKLIPTNKIEEILMKENFFPMYESTGRTFSFLGNNEVALNYMLKIVEEIDPSDSKALLQVAEGFEKIGDLENALNYYLKATNVSCPHGKIVFYKLGRVFEKLNRDIEALYAYVASLHHWPIGVSPLKRIIFISKKMNLTFLDELAGKLLAEVENDYL